MKTQELKIGDLCLYEPNKTVNLIGTIKDIKGSQCTISMPKPSNEIIETSIEYVSLLVRRKVPVIFRQFHDGDIIAFLPTLNKNTNRCVTYMHNGQHTEANAILINELPKATPEQYNDLLNELKYIYETPQEYYEPVELVVKNKSHYTYYRK